MTALALIVGGYITAACAWIGLYHYNRRTSRVRMERTYMAWLDTLPVVEKQEAI